MNTILIVDDTPEIIDVCQLFFQFHNFNVTNSSSRQSTFKQLQTKLPDIILLDVLLKDCDGRQLCKELKERISIKTIPIILMSASPQKLVNYKDYGAADILEKPFSLENILKKIKNLFYENNKMQHQHN